MEAIEKLMDPALFEIFSELAAALVNYTPEHFKHIDCVIELGAVQGTEQLLFHINCPQFPDDYTDVVNERVSDAANELLYYWEEKEEAFPGFTITVIEQPGGKWQNHFARLDAQKDFVSPIPRPLDRSMRLVGYGLRITPIGPFHWYQMVEPQGINASRYIKTQDGRTLRTHQALLLVKNGTIETQLQGDTNKESLVFKKESGPQSQQWLIETPRFQCTWPSDFALRYPAASGTMFDLVQPDNSLIYVQGPHANDKVDINDVADATQTVVARGISPCPWTELAYEAEGSRWKQRYYAVNYDGSQKLVVTVQAPMAKCDDVFAIATELAATMKPIISR